MREDKKGIRMYEMSIFNELRSANGFLTIDQLIELCNAGNIIFDPFSTLIYKNVKIGFGNVFYPNVIISGTAGNHIKIGSENIFYSNTIVEASAGNVVIGSENQFGEGGISIKANRAGSRIEIGDQGRYLGGASVFGVTQLQSGSQILGHITVDNCTLESGGSWHEPSSDKRGGLLKGFGIAKNLTIPVGKVINGAGSFNANLIEWQSVYHPVKN